MYAIDAKNDVHRAIADLIREVGARDAKDFVEKALREELECEPDYPWLLIARTSDGREGLRSPDRRERIIDRFATCDDAMRALEDSASDVFLTHENQLR